MGTVSEAPAQGESAMRPDQDAFGKEMLDHLEKGEGFEAIERDDGYMDLSGGPAPYFAPYPKWPPHQRKAMRFVCGRVLDVGCGAGRAALHLQGKGHEVVGIDASPLAVEVCRRRGVRDARVVPIERVRPELGCFDTVVMLGNNFGLFGGFDKARRLLARFRRITVAGARIVAETVDPYNTDNPAHLAYHERNRTRGRMGGQIRIRVRYKEYVGNWFDYLFVSRDELASILDGTGWRLRRTIDTDGPPYIAVIDRID